MVLAAAIQLEAVVGDVSANLHICERLADEAGRAGARIIALPEFFTTGIAFVDELKDAALPPDGKATDLLIALARRYRALVGGSFLCRDTDGHVRNAYFAADAHGVVGRHDKDLPTMWENAFYVGGHDDGVFRAGNHDVGAAVCWELMRTGTVKRLRSRVDLVMTGSGWWSIPPWPPRFVFDRWERRNAATARRAAASFAKYVGAPVVHAAHAGEVRCPMPWFPMPYRGHFEGATLITDARGEVIAERRAEQGAGVVLGEIEIGRRATLLDPPKGFWLHPRGPLPSAVWHYQRWHGRPWYRRHVMRAATATATGDRG
ncbi:carbon-nitrogen hydrolase family protein [Mycolicibacterium holsaticum]|jgi:predicted amidohydrolase|uniref:carbon-nitrogen hydrolase family protein n=1 Tax=Mycolicibacterium holsaticum TaxID=152142 RepID=UPI001C7CB774|nr:carbon-nitrogen hydrolase family protein [Mycolicibacterium holsaticum]MDA4106990.1 nitrilase [Mycolicibacterium holsaticum DSM 44478 = JCM 12374]QZA12331.1 carbon-nitrogen hydrolase family protein [Mycolicibacterium holsaticum DSM 44478 = JCM 12374]UNC10183.1 carbon-nitrogen hydrolase family protein [Mycolicibacterium holsaticum DSM 44478 = JCM 12374]